MIAIARIAAPLLALLTLPIMLAEAAAVSAYRCRYETVTRYSDAPCSDTAERIRLDRLPALNILPAPANTHEPVGPAQPEPDDPGETPGALPCRRFQSTVLRTHLIREEVVPGMTRADVIKAWGEPSEVWHEPVEMWAYEIRHYSYLTAIRWLYFEAGCVTSIETTRSP